MSKTFIHVWADIDGDWRPSSEHFAEYHAQGNAGHATLHAPSITAFRDSLIMLKSGGAQVDRMDFHTHGSPGSLAIGPDSLNFRGVKEHFHGYGLEKIFKKDARIFFHGCNVAEEPRGEMFLAVFGAIFLREGGGRIGASTSVGFAVPVSGKVWHPTGDTVYAHVRPGGSVRLQYHKHLDRTILRARLQKIASRVSKVAPRGPGEKFKLAKAKKHLAEAKDFLRFQEPSFLQLLYAASELKQARKATRHMQTVRERDSDRIMWKMMTQSMSSFK